jgi:hypothetical protein
MRKYMQTDASCSPSDIHHLTERAARQGIALDSASAKNLASLGALAAVRKLDGVCRLIKTAHDEDAKLGFRAALRRVDTCGGNAEEAIRRVLAGKVESHEGVCETVEYAADRGVVFSPKSIANLFGKHGRSWTRRYIDQLGAIMDAAAVLGIECTQILATRRLTAADGDAQYVIAGFAAEYRRRSDRQTIPCRAPIPPRELSARTNAFAGCGCPSCLDRLAAQLQHYIGKMIAKPFFNGLEHEEARAEANLELIRSAETWPGGNFTGWFAHRFERRVRTIYASRSAEERKTVSLDAPGVLADDDGGRGVPLGERIPDRSVDVLEIVLLRERVAEAALELRQCRAERGEEFTNGTSAELASSTAPRPLRLVPPEASMTDAAETMERAGLSRKAA